jgi:hypothetical protein
MEVRQISYERSYWCVNGHNSSSSNLQPQGFSELYKTFFYIWNFYEQFGLLVQVRRPLPCVAAIAALPTLPPQLSAILPFLFNFFFAIFSFCFSYFLSLFLSSFYANVSSSIIFFLNISSF